MPPSPTPVDEPLRVLLTRYRKRSARYAEAALAKRWHDIGQAVAMSRLEGAGPLSPLETEMADLWVTGRVSRQEYFNLCAAYAREGVPVD